MAAVLIPEALSNSGTVATHARNQVAGATMPGGVMPLDAIKTTLFPDWWGRPSGISIPAGLDSAGGSVNYNERTFYAGVAATLLALIALLSRGDWRRKAPLVVLAVVGLAVPLHLPVLYDVVIRIPPLDVVQNQRLHFGYELAVALLAGFGLRGLLERPAEQRLALVVPGLAIFLGLLVLVAIAPSGEHLSHTLHHFATGAEYQSRQVVELTSDIWFLLFAAAVGAGLVLAHRRPRWRWGIALALVGVVVVDGLHFAHDYQPMMPASAVVPPKTPAITYLQRHAGEQRINGLDYVLADSWAVAYGLDDIRGYLPPNPTKRLYSIWKAANSDQLEGAPYTMGADQDEQTVQVESLLGARYILTEPNTELPTAVTLNPVLGALRVVYSGRDGTIVENGRAAPRVQVPSRVEVAEDQADAESKLFNKSFLPGSQAVIETDDPAARALAGGPAAKGTVRIAGDDDAKVTLDATLDRTGLVVLNDSLMDGWTVTVDGRRAKAVRVNSLMRGVVAGPGRHEIVWSYMTPGLKAGLALSLLAWLGTVGGAVALALRARRRRRDGAALGDGTEVV
jgi:hypothetical protein